MNLNGNWNFPTPIRFGPGTISELPNACRELGMRNPLLVTDPGLAALPIVEQALQINREGDLPTGLFSEMQGNPVGDDVDRGTDALRAGGHDGVIAFGGGSALDVGKAIALMAGQTRPLWDFEDAGDNWARVDEAAMVPCVAVPTTSGTGSEVGRCSVITNQDEHRKVIIFHAKMLPGRVICDPELTLSLPAKLTAAVGMDALSHNLEAFCAPGYHPMADGIALEGMLKVHQALERACRDGADIEARADMMIASTMGATAFQKGLGAMHSMSHPVGAVIGAHHGLCNAVFMPYVLGFNRPAIDERMAHLARYLNLPGDGFSAVLDWVLGLRERLGIAHDSSALGVISEEIPLLARMGAQDPTAPTNPVPLTTENMTVLFEQSLAGEVVVR
jgi:alcohol dehydrogenase class IV